jgi:hypothetical protein
MQPGIKQPRIGISREWDFERLSGTIPYDFRYRRRYHVLDRRKAFWYWEHLLHRLVGGEESGG